MSPISNPASKRSFLVLLVLTLILILGGSIAVASGDEGQEAEGSAVAGTELPGRRTETSNTYLLPDGKMRTELFEAPVNYRDEEGKWQPIEAQLEEKPSGAIVNGDNSFDLHLPESLGTDAIRLSTEGAWVSEKPVGIGTQDAELEGGLATYEAPAEGVSFQFSGLADGLKEDIVLEDQSAPSTLHFLLEASPGLTPSLNEAGGVDFRDSEGALVTQLPAPAMSDSAASPNISNDVHYSLEPAEAGAWMLTVEASPEWLSDPSRVFPVRIDPTITTVKISAPSLDCGIANASYSETSFCGTSGWPYLGVKAAYKSTGADEYSRTLLRFNLSSIPTTASIVSATMGVYSPKEAKNAYGIELANADQLFDSTVNWKYYATKTGGKREAWTNEGGDYGSQMQNHQVGIYTSSRGAQAGWWNFTGQSLTWLVQRWLSGATPNNGVLLKLMDERWRECCIERLVEFQSSATANKPYLSVEYIPPAPTDSKVTSPTEGTRSARRFKLTAAWTHAGVTGIKWQYKSELGWVDIPANKVMDKNGQTLKAWPYAVEGGEQHSEPLYWDAPESNQPVAVVDGQVRAVLIGVENAGGYTQPVEVGLNRDTGGPKDATTEIGPGTLDLLTGNFSFGRNDVSVPGLTFGRNLNSRNVKVEEKGVLGQGWKPSAPVEVGGGSAWRELQEFVETEEGEEGEKYEFRYAIVTDKEGNELAFEVDEVTKSFITPPELAGYLLTRIPNTTQIALTDPEGNRTVFDNGGSGLKYLPVSVSTPGGAGNKTVMNYEFIGSNRRLNKIVAPTGPGVSCSVENSTTQAGCRTLIFTYQHPSEWGGGSTMGDRLSKISYYAASSPTTMGSWEVAAYSYNAEGRLVTETDPRTGLKETYTYTSEGQLKTITPPGEEPWTMQYGTVTGELSDGRLISMQRASLIESEPIAQTTIAYNVPVTGSGAPYDMGISAIAKWGQTDFPTDATAVFPPNEVPASPPTGYAKATVYYMDVEGQISNVASPAGAGMEGPSISTIETDEFGNLVRELSPQNRLRALAAGEGSVAKSHELESKSKYSADGIDLQEEWGPVHQVRLESGETVSARLHSVVQYEDPAPPAEEPGYHLPTRETSGASILGRGEDADQRVSETKYNWNLRLPKETIVDPGGEGHLHITSVTAYDEATGLPVETRQPSNSGGGGAGTTKFVYYNGGKVGGSPYPECEEKPAYAGLPCKTLPAAQASGTGRPELLVKTVKSYNQYGEPTEVVESPGGKVENVRKILFTYDAAGRQLTKKIEGGGVPIPKVETEYSPTLGLPTAERFKCETECEGPQYQSAFGLASSGHTGVNLPTDVAVDASGNSWVVDNVGNRIVEYNEAGEFLREAGGKGSAGGKLEKPSAIAIDSSGNLDVTDTANNRVAQFSSTGAFIEVIGSNVNKTKVESGGTALEKNRCTAASGNICQAGSTGSGEGQIAEPIGITTTATGTNFYVVERADNRVEKFNPQGEVLAKFGSLGSENGQLKEPTMIALHGFLLWVADTGNERMEAFTTSYVYSRKFGTAGSGNGQMNKPVGVETDSSGNVWVSEQGNNRVQKFSETGTFLLKFGTQGSAEGQFSMPAGLAIDAKGNVLIADMGNNRVQKWSAGGFDTQETKTTYDSLGRPYAYEDADGNKAETTYDLDGRPVKTTDAKGWQVVRYDSTTGMPVELEDSAAGKFTASYNADGAMTRRTLPDGLTAETTYDATGAATHLSYTKSSNCGSSCLWLDFGVETSVNGQILNESSSLATHAYGYDKAGRLISAQETPQGGGCTTRLYTYDEDSNRRSLTTRAPGVGGVCASSGGTTQSYEYDAADRLTGPTYDSFGRITSLPATLAGGKTLTTSYFTDDMVASQSQGGITNSFQLDASLRQRVRLQGGGVEGAEVFHYDAAGDSPAWTERGSTWTRNIVGLGGELAAVQESGHEPVLQLTNLHGDIAATAAISPEVSKLQSTNSYDEYGTPMSGNVSRFGWLGGATRRTELPSGVTQMGARSYVPQIGRFLSVDAVAGGSANAYDYVNQDPLNGLDLSGMRPGDRECYQGIINCECVLWTSIARRDSGQFWVTMVRKCNRWGGITLTGWAVQWYERNGDDWDAVTLYRVYPAAEPVCPRTAKCQNYQKFQALLHCNPGKHYQVSVSWGWYFNAGDDAGIEHQLHIEADAWCPK